MARSRSKREELLATLQRSESDERRSRGLRIERSASGAYVLSADTIVRRPQDETFQFFADARNLDAITPPWLRFRITTSGPIEMGDGTLIDYSLRLHGFPVRWRSRIEGWSPNRMFTDVQVKGPYRSWRHVHRFTELGRSETLVEDEVTYKVPGGRLVHWLLVRRDLAKIFEYRRSRLPELLEGAQS